MPTPLPIQAASTPVVTGDKLKIIGTYDIGIS